MDGVNLTADGDPVTAERVHLQSLAQNEHVSRHAAKKYPIRHIDQHALASGYTDFAIAYDLHGTPRGHPLQGNVQYIPQPLLPSNFSLHLFVAAQSIFHRPIIDIIVHGSASSYAAESAIIQEKEGRV